MTEQSTFTPEQSRRAEALKEARRIVSPKTHVHGDPVPAELVPDLVSLAEYVLHGLPDDEPEQTFHPGGIVLDGRGVVGMVRKGETVIPAHDARVTGPAAFIPTREAEVDPATHEEPARIYTLVDKDGDEWTYDPGRHGWTIIGGRRAHQWHDLAGLAPFTIKGAHPRAADELRRTGE